MLLLSFLLASLVYGGSATIQSPPPLSQCAAAVTVHNESGCTVGGHYAATVAADPADCCDQCSANATCAAWTFHPPSATSEAVCNLASVAKVEPHVQQATCGCRTAGCTVPPPTCVPIKRPNKPTLQPLPSGRTTKPHLVSMLIDDLGWDDTSIHGNTDVTFTPKIQELMESGIRLDRHHTYLWCSPTRRAFLSGRYPTHITGTQAPQCSNFLPLQFTVLSEKLKAADYESVFIGKGHLGYHTLDHLPVNRGFASHIGYLGGGESYKWGGTYGSSIIPSQIKHHDMWHSTGPATELIDQIYYSTNFYTAQTVKALQARNTSKPFWLHLTYQAVHEGNYQFNVPSWEAPQGETYKSATFALDDGVGNITAEMKAQGMWDDMLFVFTSDNGGDCGLPSQPGVPGQPGSASNYPLLGRKCTAFEGGTRVAAFIAGGLVPAARRGTASNQLIYITDWYPTFCNLAGVNPADDWVDPATNVAHPIDGVDVWAALSEGTDGVTSPVREWLPTTERSLIWNDGKGHMYKLIINEYKANRFDKNGTQYMDTFNACLPKSQGGGEVHVPVRHGQLTVPPSCTVCSTSAPCLFEVLGDPLEKQNVAADNAALVKTMATKLVDFNDPYIPSSLTPSNLACYNCTLSDSKGIGFFGDYWGPCCIAK